MKKIAKKSTKPHTTNTPPTEDAVPAEKTSSHPGKKILSIAIDPSLHSRLALLARAEGRSVTDLVVESVSKNLKTRLSAALDALRAEAELEK